MSADVLHRCTDPTAKITLVDDGLVVETCDPSARLLEFRPKQKPLLVVIDLTTGYCAATDNWLLADTIAQGARPPAELPRPTADDRCILAAIKESHPKPIIQVDLEATTALSRRTIGRRLKVLRRTGLTYRPGGQRSGEALTSAGLWVASRSE